MDMQAIKFWSSLVGGSVVLTTVLCAAGPHYFLWAKEMRGRATLAEAEWDRQVRIEEANAEEQAAEALAKAEVARAKGVAEANKIIGESLDGNEGYLRYLWIQGLQDGNSEVIYVPTEANLPILEAGQR